MKIRLAKKTRHVSHDNNIENYGITAQVIGKYFEDFFIKSRQIFNTTIFPLVQTQQLKKSKNSSRKWIPKKLQVLSKFPQISQVSCRGFSSTVIKVNKQYKKNTKNMFFT